MTQKEIIMRLLSNGEWIKSYELVKVNTPWGWLGTDGTRRARELVESGWAERRKNGKYEEFRHIQKVSKINMLKEIKWQNICGSQ